MHTRHFKENSICIYTIKSGHLIYFTCSMDTPNPDEVSPCDMEQDFVPPTPPASSVVGSGPECLQCRFLNTAQALTRCQAVTPLWGR